MPQKGKKSSAVVKKHAFTGRQCSVDVHCELNEVIQWDRRTSSHSRTKEPSFWYYITTSTVKGKENHYLLLNR